MEINFKKWFIAAGLLAGLFFFVKTHYSLQDVVAYARSHPDPDISPKLEYWVAMAYFFQNRYPESAGTFQLLVKDYPSHPDAGQALLRLGVIYSEENKFEEARQALQKYMDSFPNGPEIERVRQRHELIKFK
jgi:TolA-binding protein